MRRRLVASLTFLTLLCGPAWAEDDEPSVFSENTTFVSIGGTYGIEQFKDHIGGDRSGSFDVVDDPTNAAGLTTRLGARANHYLAYYVQYEWLTVWEIPADPPPPDALDGREKTDSHLLTANVKVFPFHALLDGVLQGRLQPYATGGMGVMFAPDLSIQTAVAFAGKMGVGTDIWITEQISLTADGTYNIPTGNLDGLDYWNVGLSFNWNWQGF
ncbi:MAG: hypothetical protein JRH19_21305 [Deltaproteobacteria bacterium]|nr:hypothetical protein [Deltaproteobacteria bacterium]